MIWDALNDIKAGKPPPMTEDGILIQYPYIQCKGRDFTFIGDPNSKDQLAVGWLAMQITLDNRSRVKLQEDVFSAIFGGVFCYPTSTTGDMMKDRWYYNTIDNQHQWFYCLPSPQPCYIWGAGIP